MKKAILSLMVIVVSIAILFPACSKDEESFGHSVIVVTVGEGTAKADKTNAEAGQTVTLTVTPVEGYQLSALGSANGNITFTPPMAPQVTFVMPDENVIITAIFGEIQASTIVLTTDGNGYASADKIAAKSGETVTITANPAGGYVFKGWTVEEGSVTIDDPMANPATFVMSDGSVSIKAEFILDDYDIFSLITDQAFAAYVKKSMTSAQTIDGQIYPAWDSNGDGDLSSLEIASIEAIQVPSAGIASLAGIEKFVALRYLDVRKNALKEVDLSHNTELVDLIISGNAIASLDLAKNTKLETIDCSENPLPALELGGCTNLRSLTSNDCPFVLLDISKNTRLTYLETTYNELTTLDLSNNTELVTLIISNNHFESIDISKNARLSSFNCFNNMITELDFSNNKALSSVTVSGNEISELNLTGLNALNYLNCSSNPNLIKLDVSGKAALTELICHQCALTELHISGCINLDYIYCFNNHLARLDISEMGWNSKGTYTLWCGNQTSTDGDSQILKLTLREDQKEYWESALSRESFNKNVEVE